MSDENKGAERQVALHAKVLRAIRSVVQTDMNTPADMLSIVMGALGGAGGLCMVSGLSRSDFLNVADETYRSVVKAAPLSQERKAELLR